MPLATGAPTGCTTMGGGESPASGAATVGYEDGLQLAAPAELSTAGAQRATADFRTLLAQASSLPTPEAPSGGQAVEAATESVTSNSSASGQGRPIEFFIQEALAN